MPRRAELARVALRAEDGEQVFEGVAQPFAVVIAELVDDLEEALERLRVAVGQVGVLEDAAEERRDARVLRHLSDAVGVEREHVVATEAGAQQLGPAVAGELLGEKLALAAELLGLGIHVVHELVDQGDGDLLHLGFRVGNFPDEDVAGGVDAAFGVGVEHGVAFGSRWLAAGFGAHAVEALGEAAFVFKGLGQRGELAVEQITAEVQERQRAVGREDRGEHGRTRTRTD